CWEIRKASTNGTLQHSHLRRTRPISRGSSRENRQPADFFAAKSCRAHFGPGLRPDSHAKESPQPSYTDQDRRIAPRLSALDTGQPRDAAGLERPLLLEAMRWLDESSAILLLAWRQAGAHR